MKSMGDKRPNFLLIHGFGGGVHEVSPLADHLISIGYEAVCPLLKGHSASKKEMRMVTYKDWIDSVEKELLRMRETSDDIVLIGFSMGGLIAFNLACKYKIKAIITLNTPIYFWNIHQAFLNIIDDLRNKQFYHCRRYFKETGNFPIKSLIEFLHLLRQTKPLLKNVNCPILVIQAEDDDTVKRKSVDYICQHLSSHKKSVKYFKKCGHLILLSPIAMQVMTCIEGFLHDQKII